MSRWARPGFNPLIDLNRLLLTAHCSLKLDLRRHLDRPFDTPGYRTQIGVHVQNPLHRLADIVRNLELVLGVNTAQHQYLSLRLDFPRHLGDEIVWT